MIHGNHIEAPLARKCHVAQVIPGDSRKCALFVAIHGCFGGLYVSSGARFYFDEAQYVFVPAYEVDLAAMMR